MLSYHDLSIIKQILRDSEGPHSLVVWHQREAGMYFTEPRAYFADFGEGDTGVHVEIRNSGDRVVIKFSSPGQGEVSIMEPIQKTFSIGKKYDTPEETELAEAINHLVTAVSRKLRANEERDERTTAERKQAIFRRLLGGSSSE